MLAEIKTLVCCISAAVPAPQQLKFQSNLIFDSECSSTVNSLNIILNVVNLLTLFIDDYASTCRPCIGTNNYPIFDYHSNDCRSSFRCIFRVETVFNEIVVPGEKRIRQSEHLRSVTLKNLMCKNECNSILRYKFPYISSNE